jgi:hypothetical protein
MQAFPAPTPTWIDVTAFARWTRTTAAAVCHGMPSAVRVSAIAEKVCPLSPSSRAFLDASTSRAIPRNG